MFLLLNHILRLFYLISFTFHKQEQLQLVSLWFFILIILQFFQHLLLLDVENHWNRLELWQQLFPLFFPNSFRQSLSFSSRQMHPFEKESKFALELKPRHHHLSVWRFYMAYSFYHSEQQHHRIFGQWVFWWRRWYFQN